MADTARNLAGDPTPGYVVDTATHRTTKHSTAVFGRRTAYIDGGGDPKLLVHAEPGPHFPQEDSPHEIGRALAGC